MSTSSDSTTNHHMDQDNPLHLSNSDSPGMKLVSEPFDGTGFSNWKCYMSISLSARNKLGFVDGFLPKPYSTSPTFKSWSRCNDMVISWLLGALSKPIVRSVIYSNLASQMWTELNERYGVSNGTHLFGLHKNYMIFHKEMIILLVISPSLRCYGMTLIPCASFLLVPVDANLVLLKNYNNSNKIKESFNL